MDSVTGTNSSIYTYYPFYFLYYYSNPSPSVDFFAPGMKLFSAFFFNRGQQLCQRLLFVFPFKRKAFLPVVSPSTANDGSTATLIKRTGKWRPLRGLSTSTQTHRKFLSFFCQRPRTHFGQIRFRNRSNPIQIKFREIKKKIKLTFFGGGGNELKKIFDVVESCLTVAANPRIRQHFFNGDYLGDYLLSVLGRRKLTGWEDHEMRTERTETTYWHETGARWQFTKRLGFQYAPVRSSWRRRPVHRKRQVQLWPGRNK